MDRVFDFKWVPQTYEARAMRGAVLWPLAGYCCNEPEVLRGAQAAQSMWREQLSRLWKTGWVPSVAADQIDRWWYDARNCRPAFAYTTPPACTCDVAACPFCSARQVGQIYRRIRAFYHTLTPSPRAKQDSPTEIPLSASLQPRNAYQLVERRFSCFRPIQSPSAPGKGEWPRPDDALYADEWLQWLLGRWVQHRSKFLSQLRPPGAFTCDTVEPWGLRWRFSRRQILLVRPGTDQSQLSIPRDDPQSRVYGSIRVHTHMTVERLLKIVIRTMRYPRRLLTARASRLGWYLYARRRRRLMSFAGVFRTLVLEEL